MVKTKINVDGPSAQVRLHQGDDFKLIVRAVDNNTDPNISKHRLLF